MATMADIFSQENLAKLTDGGLNSPLGIIGAQLMARGQGGAGQTGQALVGAQGAMRDQAQLDQLTQYRNSMMQQQQAQLQMAQAKAQEAAQFKANLTNPAFVAQLPEQIRGFASAGAPPEAIMDLWGKAQDLQYKQQQFDATQQYRNQQLDISRQGQSQSAAQFQQRLAQDQAQAGREKVPTPSQLIEEPTADGKFQKHIYDATTGGYKPYGAPYQKSQDALSLLLGGGTAPAVPDAAPGAVTAVDAAVNQLTPAAATAPAMVGGGSLKNAGAAAQSAPIQVKSAVDYAKVPSGAQYLTPDGVLKRKP